MTKLRRIAVTVTDDWHEPEYHGRTGFIKGVSGNKVQVYLQSTVKGGAGEDRDFYYPFLLYVPPTKKHQLVVVLSKGKDQGCVHNIVNHSAALCELGSAAGRYKFVKVKEIRTSELATFY